MTDDEAMETVIRRTGVERYRFLCSADNPNPPPNSAADYRRLMHELARPPSAARKAAGLVRAIARWARDRFATASRAEVERRLSICRTCPEWDGSRCKICGCYTAAKLRLRKEKCPIGKW